jgi:hypothetical protein
MAVSIITFSAMEREIPLPESRAERQLPLCHVFRVGTPRLPPRGNVATLISRSEVWSCPSTPYRGRDRNLPIAGLRMEASVSMWTRFPPSDVESIVTSCAMEESFTSLRGGWGDTSPSPMSSGLAPRNHPRGVVVQMPPGPQSPASEVFDWRPSSPPTRGPPRKRHSASGSG